MECGERIVSLRKRRGRIHLYIYSYENPQPPLHMLANGVRSLYAAAIEHPTKMLHPSVFGTIMIIFEFKVIGHLDSCSTSSRQFNKCLLRSESFRASLTPIVRPQSLARWQI